MSFGEGLPYLLAPAWKARVPNCSPEDALDLLDEPLEEYASLYQRDAEHRELMVDLEPYLNEALGFSMTDKFDPKSHFPDKGVAHRAFCQDPPPSMAGVKLPESKEPVVEIRPVVIEVESEGVVEVASRKLLVDCGEAAAPVKFVETVRPNVAGCPIVKTSGRNVFLSPFAFMKALADVPAPPGAYISCDETLESLTLVYHQSNREVSAVVARSDDTLNGSCLSFLSFVAKRGMDFSSFVRDLGPLFATLIVARFDLVLSGSTVKVIPRERALEPGEVSSVFYDSAFDLVRYLVDFPRFAEGNSAETGPELIRSYIARRIPIGPKLFSAVYQFVHVTHLPGEVCFVTLPYDHLPWKVSTLPGFLREFLRLVPLATARGSLKLVVMPSSGRDFSLLAWMAHQLGIPMVWNNRVPAGASVLVCSDNFGHVGANDPYAVSHLRVLRGIQVVNAPLWPKPPPPMGIMLVPGDYVRFKFSKSLLVRADYVYLANESGIYPLLPGGVVNLAQRCAELDAILSCPYLLAASYPAPRYWACYVRRQHPRVEPEILYSTSGQDGDCEAVEGPLPKTVVLPFRAVPYVRLFFGGHVHF